MSNNKSSTHFSFFLYVGLHQPLGEMSGFLNHNFSAMYKSYLLTFTACLLFGARLQIYSFRFSVLLKNSCELSWSEQSHKTKTVVSGHQTKKKEMYLKYAL